MDINSRRRDDVTILDIRGKVTIGGDLALRQAIHQALEGGSKKLVVNLQHVTTIDSSGVGELVGAYTSAKNHGTTLKLVNLPPKVQDVLTITQLITVFDVYDTEDEAVRSF